ncbi:hypothetical protein [Methylobacterium sp. J-067]|uniref:hypothetical protein n=1 Tax=Methylobacterium sp. J-067 TaxID=2836648 RepID=UPI001FB8A29E|nr:hypothetical protein [Methylobacterium sp. J-067]MCJ2026952.1 hypothetical protein [Methylobacterium sp. J-067]
MSEIILPADVDDAPLRDEDAHLHEATRATMLAETLQLGRYSAVTQGALVLMLAGILWNIASQAYLYGLAAAVTALCAAAFVALARYSGRFGERAVAREAFVVLHVLALGRGLAWASMPAVLLP